MSDHWYACDNRQCPWYGVRLTDPHAHVVYRDEKTGGGEYQRLRTNRHLFLHPRDSSFQKYFCDACKAEIESGGPLAKQLNR